MGSDSVRKSSTNKNICQRLPKIFRVLLSLLALIFLQPIIKSITDTKTVELFHPDDVALVRKLIPRSCEPTLESFTSTQRLAKESKRASSPSSQTIVFACHRKWCDSYGLCEPCRGIGDRTRHLLASVAEASRRKLSVELDYPQVGNGVDLRFRREFEYEDPWGVVSEWFHFRSYDVSGRELRLERWRGGVDGNTLVNHGLEDQFVHFIPMHGSSNGVEFDPCLYHVLFQPTLHLHNEITYYSNIFQLDTKNVLGIHFRTGDLTAWDIQNKDIRATGSNLEQGYSRMLECAEKLATRLNIHPMGNHGTEKLHFYLATDNQHVKDRAKKEKKYVIYLTDDKPSAYLRAEGDRSAFLELYLLSKTRGLVINQLPKKYEGTGTRLSTFAVLAQKIGFMDDDQIMPCSLE